MAAPLPRSLNLKSCAAALISKILYKPNLTKEIIKMTYPALTAPEQKRIQDISASFGWRYSIAIRDHFNKAGKIQDFANAATPEEIATQKVHMKHIFGKNADLATLSNLDIYVAAARRVGTDEELAALLPAEKLTAADADLLDKCQLKSLAALVRLRHAQP
ncbi:MAG: hypothetical protein KKA05_03305 [Alphaproteobacteria bacterium]|nr:hypothetical protein [Alphaproteobacteria bacterium]MBU0859114.1 hypothetical protein [Alphaproteobacteria bacterium]